MLRITKRKLYFILAYYFAFFARIYLLRWKPGVIVVTGSNGKTTLLHLIESQLKNKAKYSHKANSAYGISFDILNLHRTHLTYSEWPKLFLLAPFQAFRKIDPHRLYIVEADSDRPGEGKFLSDLLNPEVTLWLSCSRTHSANFDNLVKEGKFPTVEEAIAHEFGNFLAKTAKACLVNADSKLIVSQLNRTTSQIYRITKKGHLQNYQINDNQTIFRIDDKAYKISALLPEEAFYSISMVKILMDYLGEEVDQNFKHFNLPPGRTSIFQGIKQTTLIDSTYNATFDGMSSILEMYKLYNAPNKWVVLGDMIEQGDEEKEEHQKLAIMLNNLKLTKIILVGPRVAKYTYPRLTKNKSQDIKTFLTPKEALKFLLLNLKSQEIILFKGARFLEGIIEQLLANKNDKRLLCRREKIWEIRRKQWGL